MLLLLIILFLLLSALFSGSEIAFVSANKLKVELRKKKSARRGSVLAAFFENPSDFLGAMLVGNNIALVVFTSLMTTLLDPWFSPFVEHYFLLLLLNTIVITLVVLVFGEFLPKTFFRIYADEVLYFLAYPLRVLQLILLLPSWLMTKLSNVVLKLFFRTSAEPYESVFTRLDLEQFVNETPTDSVGEIDKELFGKALNLKDTRVRDCMVPRPEIESIDLKADVEELEQLFRETKLSRIIVIDGDIDNVLGYVHHQQMLKQPPAIQGLVMDIPFVPEVTKVIDLLNRFIEERMSVACVVDEYGGLSGLITLEDILEEIFGEIEDEHDEEEHVEQQLSENEFIFSGRLEIDYLNEKYPDLQLPEGEYHTLSGYLVMTTENIPEQGDEIELGNYRFILELVSNTKIETVRVIRKAAGEEEGEDWNGGGD